MSEDVRNLIYVGMFVGLMLWGALLYGVAVRYLAGACP